MSAINSEVQDKLLKLFNLSKFGYCGEREAARNRLDKLLEKYKMTYEEFELSLQDEKDHEVLLPFENDWHVRLIVQIVIHVSGGDTLFYKDNRRKKCFITAPFSKAIEIEFKYSLFRDFLDKEFDTTFSALVYKHDLFSNREEDQRCGKETTEEDMKEILQKMLIMDQVQVHKQIEAKK